MVSKIWREWRFPVEFALLLALAFFLPLREAPKNLFWLAYVVVWVVNRVRSREWGGRWDGWDTLILLWLGSGYLAALFAGIRTPEGNEWGAVNDLVRYLTLLFCIKRGGYDEKQKAFLLTMLATSCVLAGAEAWWNWKISHARKALELVSVGHVNHSAIYLSICAGLVSGLAFAFWAWLGWRGRGALAVAQVLLLSWIFMTDSRAAVLAVLLLVVALVAIGGRAMGAGRLRWGAAALVIGIALAIGGWGGVVRQVEHAAKNNMLAERDLIWNRALVAVAANPWFGVGMDNFSRITDERLQGWVAASGKPYVANDYRRAPHAHSLYLNTFAERGSVGLGVVLLMLVLWGLLLARRFESMRQGAALAVWCASFSGWFVTVLIGTVNTTLHHEHAMLALMTLGLLLAARPPDKPEAS